MRGEGCAFCLTLRVDKIVLRKPIPAQIRQRVSIMIKDKLTDLCVNRLLQNDLKNTCCETKLVPLAAQPNWTWRLFRMIEFWAVDLRGVPLTYHRERCVFDLSISVSGL